MSGKKVVVTYCPDLNDRHRTNTTKPLELPEEQADELASWLKGFPRSNTTTQIERFPGHPFTPAQIVRVTVSKV